MANDGTNADVFAALLRGLCRCYGRRNLSRLGFHRLLDLCEKAEEVYLQDLLDPHVVTDDDGETEGF